MPGHWVHRSVNVGTERLATLFCYAADAGQDYSIIERAGGMKSLVVADGDGWAVQPNPDHTGYQPISAFMIISHDLGNHGRQGHAGQQRRRGAGGGHVRVRHRLRSARARLSRTRRTGGPRCARATQGTARSRLGAPPRTIEVVSFSGQMMGAVLLDAIGRAGAAGDHLGRHPLGGPDGRAWSTGSGWRRATRSPGTGSTRPTRCPRSCGFGIRSRRSSTRARTVVLAKDFVAYRLTGVLATDPSDASSTNAYDQAAAEWSTELIEAADVPRSLFPDIVAVDCGGRTRHRRRRGGHRPAGRHAGGDGRRRRSDGGARCGHHRARVRCLHLPRLLVLGLGGRRRAAARPEDAQHDLQPCACPAATSRRRRCRPAARRWSG